MNEVFTLRQLLGKSSIPAALSESVLIIVDAQNAYCSGPLQLYGITPAIFECAQLLARARALKVPVIHIQHDSGPGTLFDIRSETGRIVSELAPWVNEQVVVKTYPNSFVATDLEARLKAFGAKNLLIAGFMTHNCVSSTARGAFNLGYEVAVAASATATRPLPAPDGGVVSAEELQRASLAGLGDRFAAVVANIDDIPD